MENVHRESVGQVIKLATRERKQEEPLGLTPTEWRDINEIQAKINRSENLSRPERRRYQRIMQLIGRIDQKGLFELDMNLTSTGSDPVSITAQAQEG